VIDELDGTITASAYDALRPVHSRRVQRIATLPADYAGAGGHQQRSASTPNGPACTASSRGHDSLAVYAITPDTGSLTLAEIANCGRSKYPMQLRPQPRWRMARMRPPWFQTRSPPSASILRPAAFTVSAETINVGEPVCVLFAP